MAVTHSKVSGLPNPGDASLVGGEDWDDSHVVADGSLAAAKTAFAATDKVLGRSTAGAGNGEEIAVTAAGRALIDDADAAAQRTTLGLGTAATQASGAFDAAGAAAAAAAASQPLDSDLTAIAALSTTAYGRAVLELANQAALLALLPGLNGLPLATGDVDINTHKLTNVVDPTSNQHGATKKYVDDAVAAGVSFGTPANTYGTPAAGAASTAIRTDAVLPRPGIARTTLGTTSIGASFDNPGTAPKIYYKSITLATDGFLADAIVALKGDATNLVGWNWALYADSSGPTTLIASSFSASQNMNAGTFNGSHLLGTTALSRSMPLGVWLAAGTYWLAVQLVTNTTNAILIAYASGTGSDRTLVQSQFRDNPAALTTTANDFSIAASILR